MLSFSDCVILVAPLPQSLHSVLVKVGTVLLIKLVSYATVTKTGLKFLVLKAKRLFIVSFVRRYRRSLRRKASGRKVSSYRIVAFKPISSGDRNERWFFQYS